MHTLTKVFIVLQALLSVLVAALVIPMAVNQATWIEKFNDEKARADSAENTAKIQLTQHAASTQALEKELAALNSAKIALERDLERKDTELADLRSRIAAAQQGEAEVKTDLSTLTAGNKTQADIIAMQAGELNSRRAESLQLQQRNIELEDQIRDLATRFDVALDAQRILQEQISQLKSRLAEAGSTRGSGTQPGSTEITNSWVPSPRVQGRVLSVETTPTGETFVEINLGDRDGLRENMKFILARDGKFMGNLIVTTIDINRAVGRVELEQEEGISVNDQVVGGVNS